MRRMPFNAGELEKISYIEDFYDFSTEQLQHASKNPKYAKLIKLMKTAPKNYSASVLINDLTNQSLYTGTYDETDIQIYSVTSNSIEYININYDKSTDDMEISDTINSLLTEDNVKTLFGQDITGTGDINLYRHQMTLTYLNSETENNVRIQFEVYSSNNLNVDSLQDLTNLLKPNNKSSFIGFSLDESSQLYSIRYESSIWKVAQISPPPYYYKPVLSVKDIVTTI